MIEELLKKVDMVTLGWAWLLWEDQEWVVYSEEHRIKPLSEIYRGQSLEDALTALIREEYTDYRTE